MLRFNYAEMEDSNSIEVTDNELYMNNSIWNNCRHFLPEYNEGQVHAMNIVPVRNAAGELIAYGYQDSEADRELRMIRELKENKHALQFTDVYPEYQKVVIYGCNELAVSFAEYLKALGVMVSVVGEYWDYFGYDSNYQEIGRENKALAIYAEGIRMQNQTLHHDVQRSVSPEFECIDKIYEANVLEGKICDTIGDFDKFIYKLKAEKEIVILGESREAQDTYDLLMKYGIDICGFATKVKSCKKLLEKPVMSISDAMRCFRHPIFLNCSDTHGALGGEWTEYFDYRGYERNKQFFLVRDYTDIPTSNLVHVLHGKKVLLAGDPRLCELLLNYLNVIENNEIDVRYIAPPEKVPAEEDNILCLVLPDYHNRIPEVGVKRNQILQEKLSEMGFIDYTPYFICCRCFVLIDSYLNRNNEKYTVSKLLPKGILIGRIPPWSGNVFFRGVMDGHPEVLLIPYSDINENLFYYCMRLAGIDSDKVLQNFWEMYDEEADSREEYFPNQARFEARMRSLLSLKGDFTSQELFIIFHIAYAEMINDKPMSELSDLIIYWEPHFVARNAFPFFALWLEDKKINGHTLVLRRNNIIRTGSACQRKLSNWSTQSPFDVMFLDESKWDGFNFEYSYWSEFKLRFEDIKVKPKTELMKICRLMDIAWSENMLRTTIAGKSYSYRGSVDYDLKAVFTEYAEYLSAFDRFRISIASSPYQKRYGYAYYDCMKFSRSELQDMFFKPFLFEEKNLFVEELKNMDIIYKRIQWKLWEVRKHMVLDDVKPEFQYFDLE